MTSERVSSGSRVLGEAGWKYPPLERAKDTQLFVNQTKRKRKVVGDEAGHAKEMDGWMDGLDGVMVKLPRRVGFGANYKVDAWGHTTPCIGQPLCPSFSL